MWKSVFSHELEVTESLLSLQIWRSSMIYNALFYKTPTKVLSESSNVNAELLCKITVYYYFS